MIVDQYAWKSNDPSGRNNSAGVFQPRVSAQQAIGVLVDAPAPKDCRGGQRTPRCRCSDSSFGDAPSPCRCHTSSTKRLGRIQSVEDEAKALCCVLGRGVVQLNQHGVAGLALDQRADLGLVSGALDEVALPVARAPGVKLTSMGRSSMRVAPAMRPRRSVPALRATAAFVTTGQQRQNLGAQLATRHACVQARLASRRALPSSGVCRS